MKKYHKIHTVFKRDPSTNFKTLLEDEYCLPEFEYLADNEWVFTEKVDGTNIRIMWDGWNLEFRGRTDNAQVPGPLMQRLKEQFSRDDFFRKWPVVDDAGPHVCLYGEGYGAKIQSGEKYSQEQRFVLFDVFIASWWLKRESVEAIAKELDIEIVPIVGQGSLHHMVDCVKDGFKSNWGDFQAEGVVARPTTELFRLNGSRVITKLKCKDFVK